MRITTGPPKTCWTPCIRQAFRQHTSGSDRGIESRSVPNQDPYSKVLIHQSPVKPRAWPGGRRGWFRAAGQRFTAPQSLQVAETDSGTTFLLPTANPLFDNLGK